MQHARLRTLALCLSLDFLATQSLAAADTPSRPAYPKAPRATDQLAFLAKTIGGPAR